MATKKKEAVKKGNPKFTIKTNLLKDMVSRATKGASHNKTIPRSFWMAVQLKKGKLTFITSDGTNYLYVMQDKVDGDDMYVVIEEDTFTKLVSRLTCDSTTVELKDNFLEITGNGKYSIEIPLDEEDERITYPDPAKSVKLEVEEHEINLSTIKVILNTCKPALLTTMEYPQYTGYYIGERVIATDKEKIAAMDVALLGEDVVLVPPEVMELLNVMTDEKINVYVADNNIVFKSSDCWIYGQGLQSMLDDYEADAIAELLKEKFPSTCKVNRNALLAVLDRITLFVGEQDDRAIRLTFTKEGINVESKRMNGVETLEYAESKKFKPFTCLIDVYTLIQQIKANPEDLLELSYGNDACIKFTSGNVTQITSLVEDEDYEQPEDDDDEEDEDVYISRDEDDDDEDEDDEEQDDEDEDIDDEDEE